MIIVDIFQPDIQRADGNLEVIKSREQIIQVMKRDGYRGIWIPLRKSFTLSLNPLGQSLYVGIAIHGSSGLPRHLDVREGALTGDRRCVDTV